MGLAIISSRLSNHVEARWLAEIKRISSDLRNVSCKRATGKFHKKKDITFPHFSYIKQFIFLQLWVVQVREILLSYIM